VNPSFGRHFGDGVINGSLWSVSTEIQLYFMLALSWAFSLRFRIRMLTIAACVVVTGVILNLVYLHVHATHADSTLEKIYGVTLLPWCYLFFLGSMFALASGPTKLRLSIGAVPIAMGYLAVAISGRGHFLGDGNHLNPIGTLGLAALVVAIAFRLPDMTAWLRGCDVSYGLYLWHMIIANIWLEWCSIRGVEAALAVVGISLVVALASWLLLEEPALDRWLPYLRSLSRAALEQTGPVAADKAAAGKLAAPSATRSSERAAIDSYRG
jgi:peptidoglycan/LPS O-acetylase OafA/YrhL